MSEQGYTREPEKEWVRKDYDMRLLDGKDPTFRAERETCRDLDKPIEQLLCDFHKEAEELMHHRGKLSSDEVQERMLHAQKRMVGMMAKVAIESEHLQNRIWWLTLVSFFFAVMSTVATILQLLD